MHLQAGQCGNQIGAKVGSGTPGPGKGLRADGQRERWRRRAGSAPHCGRARRGSGGLPPGTGSGGGGEGRPARPGRSRPRPGVTQPVAAARFSRSSGR